VYILAISVGQNKGFFVLVYISLSLSDYGPRLLSNPKSKRIMLASVTKTHEDRNFPKLNGKFFIMADQHASFAREERKTAQDCKEDWCKA
jgi:hypothetical protein